MATKTWTLFDQTAGEHIGYTERFGTLPSPQNSHQALGADFRLLHSGLSAGVETVNLHNGKLWLRVLPTRGMSLWKASYRADDHRLEPIEWQSPVRGPVHPSFVQLAEPSGLGWLDGFDELLVRCGLESNGAPEFGEDGRLKYPLHGRIGNKPAYKLELTIDDDAGDIALTGWVEETRFHFLKVRMKSTIRMQRDSASFEIHDEITNLSASPAEIQMLYHVNFGHPLLDAGAQVVAPVEELVPRNDHAASGIDNWDSYSAERPGYEEQVYFAKLLADERGDTRALLRNAHGTRGAVLRFNTRQLPCFTVWKNTTAREDGYVTGLEPGTNFPNPRSFEGDHGRFIAIEANGSTSFQLGFDYCPNEQDVDKAETAIGQLRTKPPKTHSQPHSDWCA